MDLLQRVYMGNTLQSWLIAVCILIILFTILKITQSLVIHRLSKLAKLTVNQFDDLLVEVLKQTKFFILLVASAYLASYAITLKPSIAALWQKAVILILIVQGGLWASAGISFWLGRTIQKRIVDYCAAFDSGQSWCQHNRFGRRVRHRWNSGGVGIAEHFGRFVCLFIHRVGQTFCHRRLCRS